MVSMRNVQKVRGLGAACAVALFGVAGCGELDAEGDGVAEEIRAALSPPNDPLFNQQWALRNTGQTVPILRDSFNLTGIPGIDINLLRAWDVTQGSPTVVVAVLEQLDTDVTHPDLRNNLFVNPGEAGPLANNGIDDDHNGYVDDVSGVDFVDRDGFNGPFDVFNGDHANHMAGIIAAQAGNGQGISGVAPKVRFLPLRARADGPSIIEAIQYARSMGAKIANVSQGGLDSAGYNLPAVRSAMAGSGMLFVCSSGNRYAGALLNFPSSYDIPNIISVANIDGRGDLANSSQYGETNVDIAAPGRGILSTLALGGYGFLDGTSESAAHVTGVAALILSKFPSLGSTQIADRIFRTGMKMTDLRRITRTAAMMDARAALEDVAPITLNATSERGRITLTWNAQAGAQRYQVERDGTMVDNGLSRTFLHANLAPDSVHFYRVRAVFAGSGGPWSHRWMKRATPEPVVISRVFESEHPYDNGLFETQTVTWPNTKRLRAHFQRVDTLPGDSVHFEVFDYDEQHIAEYSGSFPNGFWTQWFAGSLNVTLQTDDAGTAFGYRIDRLEVVMDIPDAPQAPFLNEVVPGRISIIVQCTAGSSTANIYRSTAANGGYVRLATLPATENFFDDTAVTAGRAFYYRVSCSNDLGESPRSSFLRVVAQ
jgi:hypothetical protein